MSHFKSKFKTSLLRRFFKNTYIEYLELKKQITIFDSKMKDQSIQIAQLLNDNEVKNKQLMECVTENKKLLKTKIEVNQLKEELENSVIEKNQLATAQSKLLEKSEVISSLKYKLDTLNHKIVAMQDLEKNAKEYTSAVERMFWDKEARLIIADKALEIVGHYYNQTLIWDQFENYKWEHVYKISEYNVDLYIDISKHIQTCNINHIAEKNKIKVGFLTIDVSTWSCESLYQLLLQDDRYEPYLIVIPFNNGTIDTINEMYTKSLKYFEDHGYNVKGGYSVETSIHWNYEEMGSPDIVFYLNPHNDCLPERFKIDQLNITTLTAYIPYGIMTFGKTDMQFNQTSHHLFWKIFCTTQFHKDLAKKYSLVKDYNVEVSGYLKMDAFFIDTTNNQVENLWKVDKSISNVKDAIKIIYAPHHTVVDEPHSYSTFSSNYLYVLEYARTHPETSWVFKPHPLLKKGCLESRLFSSEDGYDQYMEHWKNLPNGNVITEDSYIELFKTSDGMILDSVSFLSEYLYAHKPLLFLTKPSQSFNEYGKILKEIHYTCPGDNMDEIEAFIDNVLILKNDKKLIQREAFFEEMLNYPAYNNGKLASEYIVEKLNHWFE